MTLLYRNEEECAQIINRSGIPDGLCDENKMDIAGLSDMRTSRKGKLKHKAILDEEDKNK